MIGGMAARCESSECHLLERLIVVVTLSAQPFIGCKALGESAVQDFKGQKKERTEFILRSFTKKKLRCELLEKLAEYWNCCTVGREAYNFLPKVQFSSHFLSFSPQIVHLISGHGPFPSYLFKVGKICDT